jgi:hypothetical protein
LFSAHDGKLTAAQIPATTKLIAKRFFIIRSSVVELGDAARPEADAANAADRARERSSR